VRERQLTTRFRLLGLLPLGFFFAQAIHYWQIDQVGHMLWMCNIGNLLLAVGLFIDEPVLIRVAVIWSIPGIIIWARYVVSEWFQYALIDWGAVAASTLAHLGGMIVGLIALVRVRMDRASWLYSLAWFIVLQLVSRAAAPPELNVNVSRSVYGSWQGAFNAYWKFWLVLMIVVAVTLWLIAAALRKLWPCSSTTQVSEL
jgi:hypothetical protein